MGSIFTLDSDSTAIHDPCHPKKVLLQKEPWKYRLRELYSENVAAKILRSATEYLKGNVPPTAYPETVPQYGLNQGRYESREVDFWTCGFFPGCIYSLLETCIKHPEKIALQDGLMTTRLLVGELEALGQQWSDPISNQAFRVDTHDLGFVIMPHMRPRWELFHDNKALDVIIQAAESLSTRFDPRVQAIRSWDTFDWHDEVSITSLENNFLVIIDSMCNMDLLFYAAAKSGNDALAKMAVCHSRTLLKSHLRRERATRNGYSGMLYSTPHLVNFDPKTGGMQEVRTAQGYSDDSTWTRGQAWGILGYAQTYQWSGHAEFLDAACGLAEYFLLRLETAPNCVETISKRHPGKSTGRYVPLWDFDAPIEDERNPLRDTSAGVIAANGMLILSQSFAAIGNHQFSARYLESALTIVEDTLDFALAEEQAHFSVSDSGGPCVKDVDIGKRFDAILKHATVCFNASSFRRNKAHDHGLVYADYYLLEFGSRLLQMGIL